MPQMGSNDLQPILGIVPILGNLLSISIPHPVLVQELAAPLWAQAQWAQEGSI